MTVENDRPRRAKSSRIPRTAGWLFRKNWDRHVSDLHEMASSAGFRALRDQIVHLARLRETDRVLDVGSGTGLLTLAIAPEVQHVWALDISAAMSEHLGGELARQGIGNVEVITASATALPLADRSVDVVVSNYCYHHLRHSDKELALAEANRVLRPDGRLVIGDMMFRLGLAKARNRKVIGRALATMLRRGPAGLLRLAKNGLRVVAGRWEHPADAPWWGATLVRVGFVDVHVQLLNHEGGLAIARRRR